MVSFELFWVILDLLKYCEWVWNFWDFKSYLSQRLAKFGPWLHGKQNWPIFDQHVSQTLASWDLTNILGFDHSVLINLSHMFCDVSQEESTRWTGHEYYTTLSEKCSQLATVLNVERIAFIYPTNPYIFTTNPSVRPEITPLNGHNQGT